MLKLRRAMILLAALSALMPVAAQAWWNGEWSMRKKLTLDAGPNGLGLTEALGATPVLIRLSASNFTFAAAKQDGSDLRFVAGDDKTPLKFHVEKFDPLLEMAIIWVQIPEIKAGSTQDVWMYWGNEKAPVAGDARGTYSASNLAVFHFAEQSGAPTDASGFANNATATTAQLDEAGLIGQGNKFDGTQSVTLPLSPSLAIPAAGPWSFSTWVRVDQASPRAILFQQKDAGKALTLHIDNLTPVLTITDGTTPKEVTSAQALVQQNWHHVAVTLGAKATLYVDGNVVGTVDGPFPDIAGAPTLGGDGSAAGGLVGGIDEVHIAKAELSQTQLRAAVLGEGPNDKALQYGADEQTSTWDSGYFGILLKAVTLDGWVVIGICAVMLVLAIFVMIGKTALLNRTAKADELFRQAYHKAMTDLAVLQNTLPEQAIATAGISKSDLARITRDSVLYRLFASGAYELRGRHSTAGAAAVSTGLSGTAITAIRAAVDARAVRENQRLNRAMVLLTIAISGGPFLGLLGTVVGVMITFAAVAAAGDVNVNAIAPGIAGALLATCAGLAVAIPALFGYNYLLTRIKDQTANMTVFLDEFVARVAERLGD